ncbi:MAG: hydroxyacylglutathione hydrolase [Polyangiaceae bacterium]|nr:hydroxyacylglutathione hydrolase [Polyangiaceae bacterium]
MTQPRVVPVPCLSDNYAYLVHLPGSTDTLVVDPSEPGPVEAALAQHGLTLVGILATHHHMDHVGGNEALAASREGLPIVASKYDENRVPGVTKLVNDGDTFDIAGLHVRCITVPGHTLGAVSFVIGDAVFTGDTLFIGGCGRLFEGTPAQMYDSLCVRLAALPGDTRVYCGHEYTASNARFAAVVEPGNDAITKLAERAKAAGQNKEPTVPSTIAAELAHNPFMRVREPSYKARYGSDDPATVLGKVRAEKDNFRG